MSEHGPPGGGSQRGVLLAIAALIAAYLVAIAARVPGQATDAIHAIEHMDASAAEIHGPRRTRSASLGVGASTSAARTTPSR